ncbi:tRNA-splicing endonuclease subunit [Trichinella spiralis]|uniref:tRNA-splicing endonuclease subunit n=1 Tax=Trichinella spiralis TaxID=6334 RepID=A0ABR3KNS8_TRISP
MNAGGVSNNIHGRVVPPVSGQRAAAEVENGKMHKEEELIVGRCRTHTTADRQTACRLRKNNEQVFQLMAPLSAGRLGGATSVHCSPT